MSEVLDLAEIAKYDLLRTAQSEGDYRKILSKLDAKQLKNIQKHYWDFLIGESQAAPTKINRSDILARLEPTAKYQQRARCKEPEGYCTISMCVRIDPKCAVSRISEIMLSIRPLIATLTLERPELLLLQDAAQLKLDEMHAAAVEAAKPAETVEGDDERRNRIPETVSEVMKLRFAKHREILGKMVELDGLEHAILMTKGGGILQYASSQPRQLEALIPVIMNEIEGDTEQGIAIGFKPLLCIIKEYTSGVVAIRSLGSDLYLVGFSTIILPAKIHSLITKLSLLLIDELQVTGEKIL
jgi:hypothetical protein